MKRLEKFVGKLVLQTSNVVLSFTLINNVYIFLKSLNFISASSLTSGNSNEYLIVIFHYLAVLPIEIRHCYEDL